MHCLSIVVLFGTRKQRIDRTRASQGYVDETSFFFASCFRPTMGTLFSSHTPPVREERRRPRSGLTDLAAEPDGKRGHAVHQRGFGGGVGKRLRQCKDWRGDDMERAGSTGWTVNVFIIRSNSSSNLMARREVCVRGRIGRGGKQGGSSGDPSSHVSTIYSDLCMRGTCYPR